MRALVIGAGGQDGHYLTRHLLELGRTVTGVTRSGPVGLIDGVWHLRGDLTSGESLEQLLLMTEPDEVYNLAAVTAPGGAWGKPEPAGLTEVTALGVVSLLDAVLRAAPAARVVHASSSAVYDPHRYGLYGISKKFAHEAVIGYRSRVHASNAVLYSHTSSRQDGRFLAPTACSTLARIRDGSTEKLTLTELGGRRDWGYAPDFIRALPLIAAAEPGDYDVATGETHSVGEFVDIALAAAGLTWAEAVTVRPGPPAPPERPANISPLTRLGWKPETSFADMIREMVG